MSSLRVRTAITFILIVMTSTLSTLSDNLFLPSLPHLPAYFHTTREMVKYTVSLSMLAYGSGLLFFGPLSERFGRKPVLVIAMAVFTAVSFLCTVATTIEQLIVGRVLQGVASGAEGVLVMAILVDLFDAKGQVRAFSIYRAACAIPPIFAPILGTYVYLAFGWQANFRLLTAIAATVTVSLAIFLRESHRATPVRHSFGRVLSDYALLARSRSFLCLALIMSAAIGFLVVFHMTTPFVLFEVLHQKTQVFGYVQACTMSALILGHMVAGRLVKRVSIARLMLWAVLVVIAGNILLLLAATTGALTLFTFGGAILIIAFGSAPLMSTVPALVMRATSVPTGASAAMLLTITSVTASITAVIEGRVSDGSVASYVAVLSALPCIALIAYWVGVRGRPFARD
ncbi:MAG: MFS transporter [Proteobacteria bacterium]|nr:MFS transporter [Pseudomonadota bacterium]